MKSWRGCASSALAHAQRDWASDASARDSGRVLYYANYTSEMRRAIYEDGVDVRGYFAWSLLDNFEWEMGYTERFGLVYTDFATQARHIT